MLLSSLTAFATIKFDLLKYTSEQSIVILSIRFIFCVIFNNRMGKSTKYLCKSDSENCPKLFNIFTLSVNRWLKKPAVFTWDFLGACLPSLRAFVVVVVEVFIRNALEKVFWETKTQEFSAQWICPFSCFVTQFQQEKRWTAFPRTASCLALKMFSRNSAGMGLNLLSWRRIELRSFTSWTFALAP